MEHECRVAVAHIPLGALRDIGAGGLAQRIDLWDHTILGDSPTRTPATDADPERPGGIERGTIDTRLATRDDPRQRARRGAGPIASRREEAGVPPREIAVLLGLLLELEPVDKVTHASFSGRLAIRMARVGAGSPSRVRLESPGSS